MATRVTKGLGGKRSIRDRRRVGLSLLAVGTVLLAGPSIAPSALAASTARLVRDINPGGAGSDRFDPDVPDLGRPANVGGNVFFPADDGTHGLELWRSNGTKMGTRLAFNINPGESSSPFALTNVGGTLFFDADDGSHGSELWKYRPL